MQATDSKLIEKSFPFSPTVYNVNLMFLKDVIEHLHSTCRVF